MGWKRFTKGRIIIDIILFMLLALGLYLSQNKADLIVMFNIRTANAIVMALIIIAIAMLALISITHLGIFNKSYQAARRANPAPGQGQGQGQAGADVYSEGYVRERLEHFFKIRPRLHDELTQGLAQLDSIIDKQAALKEVRSRNQDGFLGTVAESLDKAKASIIINMLAIIDKAEIWNPKEAGDAAWSEIYDERRKQIHKWLNLNEELLRESARLLTKATELANDRDLASSERGKSDLLATIKAIEQLREISGLNEVKK